MYIRLTLAAIVAFIITDPNLNCAQVKTAKESIGDFDVHPSLRLSVFASEPMLVNPTNIDIDHLGRVWVAEAVNYRNKIRNGDSPMRKEGDRILVLEDTDEDGRADKSTTFYQDPSINSPHGVCVLGNTVIVSAGDSIVKLVDTDNDLVADKKQVLFTGIRGVQHDHGVHAVVFGPDGRLYFNFGNEGKRLLDAIGRPVIDLAGNEVKMKRPYQNGMIFRCNLDGTQVETLAWNFRNNWEVCVDSFGRMWQSDNDDDGNRATRINYVIPYGNYGFSDEKTGAGWRTRRTGQAREIPSRHWHLNDPGVVPNLLITGAGSPTGITVYEGKLLPEIFQGNLLHCDAGPNVVRAYPLKRSGAGFQAESIDILNGSKKNKWFRPSDVCTAPDGSIFVSDWFDAGVGGHRMVDIQGGRIYRMVPKTKSTKYKFRKFDFGNVYDSAAGLASPNQSVRFVAWQALKRMGEKSVGPLMTMATRSRLDRTRARAIWFLGKECLQEKKVKALFLRDFDDKSPAIRATMIRLVSQMETSEFTKLFWDAVDFSDPAPEVRRELLIAMRQPGSLNLDPKLWSQLAMQSTVGDRWYLEALGIAADGNWDDCLSALSSLKNGEIDSPIMRDIVWRSRAKRTPELLSKLILAASKADESLRYFRAFDFCPGEEAAKAVRQLAFTSYLKDPRKTRVVVAESTSRFLNSKLTDSERKALTQVVASLQGTNVYVELIKKFALVTEYDRLLDVAITKVGTQEGVDAISALFQLSQENKLKQKLLALAAQSNRSIQDNERFVALLNSLASTGKKSAAVLIGELVKDNQLNLSVRRKAISACGKLFPGSLQLIEWAESGDFDSDLEPALVAALSNSMSESILKRARKRFPNVGREGERAVPSIKTLLSRKGDRDRGAAVFKTDAAQCAKCHVVRGQGKSVGPDLSEIGSKLTRAAMYEAILYPSAGVSHGFENWSVITVDGEMLSGLKLTETDKELVIQDKDGIKRTVAMEDVEEQKVQKLSLMPSGLHNDLTDQQLADVVAYLISLRKEGDSAGASDRSSRGMNSQLGKLERLAQSEFDGVRFVGAKLTGRSKSRFQQVNASLVGARDLYLVVSDAGDGYSFDWGGLV